MAGAQQLQEVEPALRTGGGEPGEAVVADLGAVAVLRLVACAGVVDRHPCRGFQPRAQHRTGLRDEAILILDQQPHHLPLGDLDADGLEQFYQPRHGDLPLVVLRQHEAPQLRPEMAVDPARQRCHHGQAIGRHPALAAEPGRRRADNQILNDERLVALEARARRNRSLHHPILDHDTRQLLGAATTALAAPTRRRLGCARLLHAARLQLRTCRQPLQSRDLIALLGDCLLQLRHLAQKPLHQSLQLGVRQTIESGGRQHSPSDPISHDLGIPTEHAESI
ncbi:hypothetical protein BAL199_00660 [alpha proteobacterium BAL199]|nr:hypothetical protein BAL199_00660 [alpha proteobacterium BAL199]